MEVPENNGRQLKEVFSMGRKEFEKKLKLHVFDNWAGMEFLVDDDVANYNLQDDSTPSNDASTTPPSEKGTTMSPVEKGTTMSPVEKWTTMGPSEKATTVKSADHAPPLAAAHGLPSGAGHAPLLAAEHGLPSGAGHALPPSENRPTMKPLEVKPTSKTPSPWDTHRPIDNEPHPYRPSWMWTPAEKISTMRPYYLPPTKAINEWNPHDRVVNHFDWGLHLPKYKFVFVTEPPPVHYGGGAILKIIFSVLSCLAAFLIIASYAQRNKRTRRGRVLAADAGALEQCIVDDRRPSEPGEPGPLNNDLPPPYHECTLYSMNKCVGDVPPPTDSEDAKQQDHKQRTNQCNSVKNNIGFDCLNENVAPEMRTELVFDNGRIVERPSFTNNEIGVSSNDNVEQQSTRNADFSGKVVYIDEPGNVKGKINK